ncbi:MAG TPA: hypothetical protein VFV67_29260 [Actinophytocola sp.]|uniref:hypothetical protein n=1 Tax=Actinophytocola sp. TaxID=1872138 RepID=UPI002DB6FFF7|nr:hypothetical protein [Actinophytocola sp.]HEU5474753.1 hypothetical protein [Actinophytocola sp.]
MRNKVLLILGIIAILVGGIWTLQGAGVIGGSFMSGSQTWLIIGLIVAILGIILIFEATRARRRRT